MSRPNDAQDEFAITCADAVELVTDYLENALDAGDLVRFEAHLATCEGCSTFLLQIQTTVKLSRATEKYQKEIMPANFDELAAMLRDRS